MAASLRLRRVWARAILAVAGLLTAAEAVVLARRRGSRSDAGALQRLVHRLQTENEILRARLLKIEPVHRPRYTPWERLRILWHRARYGLSLRATARVFVVEASTVQRWVDAVRTRGLRLARTLQPVNRLPDLVRHLAALLRFEQAAWGTRRIAQVLARLGIQVSRSSVQRILKRKPRRPRRAADMKMQKRGSGGIRVREPHHVWLIDMTTKKSLFGFFEIRVGAILDAFSRSVVALRVHWTEPNAAWVCDLVRQGIRATGTRPGHVITDHGRQFTARRFVRFLSARKIRRRYGAVGSSRSTARLERFWRTLKSEWLGGWLVLWFAPRLIERRLQDWLAWYHRHRPHQGLAGRTPDDVLRECPAPRAKTIKAGGHWHLSCEHFAGHRDLPVYRLRRAA